MPTRRWFSRNVQKRSIYGAQLSKTFPTTYPVAAFWYRLL
jgi:hypothetical protein